MALNSERRYYTVVISSYLFFVRDGKILLARRVNTGYRDGEYSVPAGHIEEGEFATEAAIREAREEVGVEIAPEDLRPAHITHRHCGDHERIDFFFAVERWVGEIINAEPEKCDDIRWCAFDTLPENIVPYIREAIMNYRAGRSFSEFTEISNKVFGIDNS